MHIAVYIYVYHTWHMNFSYSKTCVRQPTLKWTLVVDMERWLSYKGTCHVILLAKLHDMYLYKTDNFFHINHYLKSVSKVALFHRFTVFRKAPMYVNVIKFHTPKFLTKWQMQTVQTHITLLLKQQSDQDLHCLLFN